MSNSCTNCGRPVRKARESGFCWLCDRTWEQTVSQDRYGTDAGKIADERLRLIAEIRAWKS